MEQEILTCIQQQRYPEAFERLLPEFQNKVFRLAYSILGDEGLAEDVAQEVFVRIWKALPGFRGQSSLSTWIYAIARNACLTALRTEGGRKESSLEEPAVAMAAEESCKQPSTHAGIDVLRMLGELPERYQQVLRLYYLEEKSYEEVARMLDLPMGTVKTYLHRARKELAEALMRSKMEK